MSATVHLRLAAFAALEVLKTLLAFIGVVAIVGFMLQSLRPELPDALFPDVIVLAGDLSGPKGLAPSGAATRTAVVLSAREREQQAVTEYIAKRYRVSEQAIAGYVAHAYEAGARNSVDPLLILAVMAIESRYNPVAESVVGAKGLMQVIPKYHQEKLLDHGGEQALLDPAVNIQVGAQVLREYSRRLGGDTEAALQMYNGAFDDPTSRYANKVFAEKALLEVFRQKARKQSAQSA